MGPKSIGCDLCKAVAVTLRGGGVVHWERHDTPDLHYMATAPAMRRRQWAAEDRLRRLRDQIHVIHEAGRVAWVDVKENGDFVLYQAAHGQVPVNLPRTVK